MLGNAATQATLTNYYNISTITTQLIVRLNMQTVKKTQFSFETG